MRTIIRNATLVNEGLSFLGHLVIEDECISEILLEHESPSAPCDVDIDATGMFLIPGVIDDHVHFRDPGLTHKADIVSESCAAAAGGVTSYMDMPNTIPQTTSIETLEAKFAEASTKSMVNYSFFFGATNDNAAILPFLDKQKLCGVKLFMGSSTGNMLVDRMESLRRIFGETDMLIAAHCEDQAIISRNAQKYLKKSNMDKDVPLLQHRNIRSAQACFASSRLAVKLAKEAGARLHLLHISTARELDLFESLPLSDKRITAEACVSHLFFHCGDYRTLGGRIKCNPSIKRRPDRDALREAINSNLIDVIATDHAPHLLSEKQGGALKATSGMPMIQFSLVSMLELVNQGVFSIEKVVEKMCHAPARLYGIEKRGYLREGYMADLVLVRPDSNWLLTPDCIKSKCGWSPLEGYPFGWRVEKTFVNGHLVYNGAEVDESFRGQELRFV